MQYTKANAKDWERVIEFHIIINRSNNQQEINYSCFEYYPYAWLSLDNFVNTFTIRHKGIKFHFYEVGRPLGEWAYFHLANDTLIREDLDKS